MVVCQGGLVCGSWIGVAGLCFAALAWRKAIEEEVRTFHHVFGVTSGIGAAGVLLACIIPDCRMIGPDLLLPGAAGRRPNMLIQSILKK